MPHFAKPFFRARRGVWHVKIQGQEHNLGRDQQKAFERYHRLMGAAARGLPPEPISETPTVLEILDRFCEWSQQNQPAATSGWYTRYCQSFMKHVGADLLVSELRAYHIHEWIQQRQWSASTRYGAIASVKRAFRWAKKLDYIPNNPIADVEKPEPGRREIILTQEQVNAITDDADDSFLLFLRAMLEQGCRPTEVRTVRREWVDWEQGLWVFPRINSKGKRFKRVVYLTPWTLETCRTLAEQYADGPLFRNTQGRPWSASAVRSRLWRAQKRLGLPPGTSPYTLRHTFITDALVNGVDSKTLAVLVGHKSTRMIDRVYAHLDQKTEAMKAAAIRAAGTTA